MRNSPLLLQLAILTLLPGVCSNAQTRRENGSSQTSSQSFLSLDYANDGQSVDTIVGERIELRLGAVGGPSYGDPQISSPAIRLDANALQIDPSGMISPGGPTHIYMFEAVAEGEAQVKVPLNGALDPETGKVKTLRTFSMTIRVGPARGNSRRQGSPLRLDQANSPPWSGAWTTLDHLLPVLRRSECVVG
jgi:hypothetical protein